MVGFCRDLPPYPLTALRGCGKVRARVFVFILHIPPVNARLEVGGVFDAVRRVHVDHLDLSRHPLLDQKGVHHEERVTQDKSVGPTHLVLVKLYLLIGTQRCFAEKGKLRFRLFDSLKDSPGRDALMDVQRDDIYFKGGVFGFSSPNELRIEMWIIFIASRSPLLNLICRRNPCRRVVLPPGLLVPIIPYLLILSPSSPDHILLLL